MTLRHKLRKLLWKKGWDISRFTPALHPIAKKQQFLSSNNIDLILDVGANVGQFAMDIRNEIGYTGQIISFEPLSSAFKLLKVNSKNNMHWKVYNYALGDDDTNGNVIGTFVCGRDIIS